MTLLGYSAVGNIYLWHNFLVCQETECGQTKMTHLFSAFFFSSSHLQFDTNSSNKSKDNTENNKDYKSNKNNKNNKNNKRKKQKEQ